ncbi:hypothetical protein BCR39DRAFT_505243 [Naematelia encephala]|uniref:Uncharacterized protein n=1 Tax=Naematelia encephala TaxID=71784 RepID=A0A1Y2B7Z3_9TREE|nr:hypothetical protein BCR39DRAFT_505243 [Naematelia encephala]
MSHQSLPSYPSYDTYRPGGYSYGNPQASTSYAPTSATHTPSRPPTPQQSRYHGYRQASTSSNAGWTGPSAAATQPGYSSGGNEEGPVYPVGFIPSSDSRPHDNTSTRRHKRYGKMYNLVPPSGYAQSQGQFEGYSSQYFQGAHNMMGSQVSVASAASQWVPAPKQYIVSSPAIQTQTSRDYLPPMNFSQTSLVNLETEQFAESRPPSAAGVATSSRDRRTSQTSVRPPQQSNAYIDFVRVPKGTSEPGDPSQVPQPKPKQNFLQRVIGKRQDPRPSTNPLSKFLKLNRSTQAFSEASTGTRGPYEQLHGSQSGSRSGPQTILSVSRASRPRRATEASDVVKFVDLNSDLNILLRDRSGQIPWGTMTWLEKFCTGQGDSLRGIRQLEEKTYHRFGFARWRRTLDLPERSTRRVKRSFNPEGIAALDACSTFVQSGDERTQMDIGTMVQTLESQETFSGMQAVLHASKLPSHQTRWLLKNYFGDSKAGIRSCRRLAYEDFCKEEKRTIAWYIQEDERERREAEREALPNITYVQVEP